MLEEIAKYVLIFGLSFLGITFIGYVTKITALIPVYVSPTGGISHNNIPTILSALITIIIFLIRIIKKNKL